MMIYRSKPAAKGNVFRNVVFLLKYCRHSLIARFVSVFAFALSMVALAFAQTATPNIGTEITEVKIEVRKPVKDSAPKTEKDSKNKKAQAAVSFQSLPISEVPILEGDEKLVVKFCRECKTRKFEDLGFKKMLVFFVNPASVYADFNNNFEKAFKEISFDFKSKKKKAAAEDYVFDVPYRSIPLIFLVTDGDYKSDLRKVILEKQADVIKLGEQSNLLAELPQTIQYLSKVKEVLSAPGTINNSVAESLVQRAQFFKLDNTNCFQQPLLTDQAKLSCLSKTFNVAEFEKDLSTLSFDKYGKLVGQEAVSQLRTKYVGMNVFLDATVTVIELVGAMFKKKPLNIQISALDTGKVNQQGFVSLRQIPVNMQSNTERALLIAPLKWREKDAVPTAEMLKTVSLQPARMCLQPGNNMFSVKTENALVKQEIKKVSLDLIDKDRPNQQQQFANLPVNLADGSVAIALDEKLWQKMKNWQKITAKARFDYNFETVEKDFELNILPEPNWQMLVNANAPLRKNGQDAILRFTPNTVRRECLDKVVVTDQNNQKIELSRQKGLTVEPGGIVQLTLPAQEKDKLQTGKLTVAIYEGGAEKPSGQLSVNLLEKQPQYKVSAYINDVYGEIRGERLNEIKTILIDGRTAFLEAANLPNAKAGEASRIKFSRGISKPTANISIELTGGDFINQTISLLPARPRIAGALNCQPNENQSRVIINKKAAYKAFELGNCVYPTDTDEIKLIVVSDGDNYNYSTVNKPTVNIGFLKGDFQPNSFDGSSVTENTAKTSTPVVTVSSTVGNYIITTPSTVMSPRRLDVSIKIDQKIREQLEDGNRMYIKINDPVRGASDWQPIEIKFLRMPTNLALNCVTQTPAIAENAVAPTSESQPSTENAPASKVKNLNQKCELSGNLSMIEKISLSNDKQNKTEQSVGLTSDKVIFEKSPSENFLYLKLRGSDSQVKVNIVDLETQSISQTPK